MSGVRGSKTIIILHRLWQGATLLGLAVVLGCNNFANDFDFSDGSGDSVTAGNPFSGGGSSSIGFSLVNVVPSSTDPQSNLDLIGDGSDAFGQLCISSGSSGASTCNCAYSYTSSAGFSEQIEVPTLYVEANLIRCAYTDIPAGVTEWDVSVHLTSADVFSNAKNFSLAATSGVNLDLSNINSFFEVKRYQCRDSVFIPYMFDGGIYDPIQSERTVVSYPLNFYTTSIGRSILALEQESVSNAAFYGAWECTFNEYNKPFWENLKIYSKGADANGSKLIYPGSTSAFDRSTFYLAREKSGIFDVPFNTIHIPYTPTSESDGSDPNDLHGPIGYGASPIPIAGGGETCPVNQVTLPDGYHWVKVFAFRGDLQKRSYVKTTKFGNTSAAIFCNPGDYPSGGDPVFADCGDSNVGSNARSLANASTSTDPILSLSARVFPVLQNNQQAFCSQPVDAPGGAFANRPYTETGSNNPFDDFPQFTDTYQRWGDDNNVDSVDASATPWNFKDPIFPGTFLNPGDISAPFDSDLEIDSNQIDVGQSRYDYIFVATPITVMRETIMNELPGHEPYHPYTFKSKDDCDAVDPDSDPGCSAKKSSARLTSFKPWETGVSLNPDAKATDPTRLPVFPICAIQPD